MKASSTAYKIVVTIAAMALLTTIFVISYKRENRREIKQETAAKQPTPESVDIDEITIGAKPQTLADGSYSCVRDYLRKNLNDYDSCEFVEWSQPVKFTHEKQLYWAVKLRLRAKNRLGAYIIKDTFYLIRHEQVVSARGL